MVPAELNEEIADEVLRLRFGGRLTVARLNLVARRARQIAPDGLPLVIDLTGVEHADTAGAWVIYRLIRDWKAAGLDVRIDGGAQPVLDLVGKVGENDKPVRIRPDPGHPVLVRLAELGRFIIESIETFGGFLAFLGEALITFARAVRHPSRLRWPSIIRQMEVVGVNSLAIVGLMSFLIGIVIAQQGAVQLRQFGAEVFTINLIGRSVLRELGVLMTSIMVAGRSGSAFAAQIGSMKLAEEIDAMRTIGVNPVEALTLPRLIATAAMMPLLSFYAAILGMIGGAMFTWASLGIPLITFVQRTQEVVPITDLWVGLIKAPVFGIIIAVTGCYHGMQVSGNAESVGMRTTAAVVQAIFLVIVLDAFFAVFFSALGWI